jgi:hypothetical protein
VLQDQNPSRKLILRKREGTRCVGRPAIRWLNSFGEDLKTIGVRNWRRNSWDRDQWRAIIRDGVSSRTVVSSEEEEEEEEKCGTFNIELTQSVYSSGGRNESYIGRCMFMTL